MTKYKTVPFDYLHIMNAAGLIAADAQWSGGIFDVGAGPMQGIVVCYVTAVEIDSSNEVFINQIQGSNSATFASGVVSLGCMIFAHATAAEYALSTWLVASDVGRYDIYFTNVQNNTVYRYIRGYTTVQGTIGSGINFTAYLAKDPSNA